MFGICPTPDFGICPTIISSSESVLRLFRVMESMEIGNKDTGQVFYWIYRSKMVMESMEIGDKRRRTSVLLYLKKRIGHGE